MNIAELATDIKDIIHWLRHAEIETVQKIHDLLNPSTPTVEVSIAPTEAATIAAAPAPTPEVEVSDAAAPEPAHPTDSSGAAPVSEGSAPVEQGAPETTAPAPEAPAPASDPAAQQQTSAPAAQ